MMGESENRNIADYTAMIAVRRRRSAALNKKITDAHTEYARLLGYDAGAKLESERCLTRSQEFLSTVNMRTQTGQTVTIEYLQCARKHAQELHSNYKKACQAQINSNRLAEQALTVCTTLVSELHLNEGRVASLTDLAKSCRLELSRAAEEREEEENNDLRRQKKETRSR